MGWSLCMTVHRGVLEIGCWIESGHGVFTNFMQGRCNYLGTCKLVTQRLATKLLLRAHASMLTSAIS
jgi:hypothetical protein